MQNWLIEWIGGESLARSFLGLSTMTLPIWVLLLVFPRLRITQQVCRPFALTSIYAAVLPLIIYRFYAIEALPSMPPEFNYEGAKSFAQHPMIFLGIVATGVLFNLFTGLTIHREAALRAFDVRVSVFAAACFAPLGILLYSIQLTLRSVLRLK